MRFPPGDRIGAVFTRVLLPAVVLLVLLGVALALALRRPLTRRPNAPPPDNWAGAAGQEFAALSEAERCDLIFAVAALDDAPSEQLLARALDDPSEAVALAAACSLARLGHSATLERYLARCSRERAQRISQTLELLA